jgi:hypothetical protein
VAAGAVLQAARVVVAVVAASAAAQIVAVADRAVSASDGQIVAGIVQPLRGCRRQCQACLVRARSLGDRVVRVRGSVVPAAPVAHARRLATGQAVLAAPVRGSAVLVALVVRARRSPIVARARVVRAARVAPAVLVARRR